MELIKVSSRSRFHAEVSSSKLAGQGPPFSALGMKTPFHCLLRAFFRGLDLDLVEVDFVGVEITLGASLAPRPS